MRLTRSTDCLLNGVGRLCRTVASALIAGFRRGVPQDEVEARIAGLPLRDQTLVTAAVLAALFLVSLLAAQFGLLGLAAFWLTVIFLVR